MPFELLLLLLLIYMHGIYNYIPETNHVSSVCSVAAVLYLQFILHVMLLPMLNLYTFTLALPVVCSSQYGFFLQFLNFVLSRYVAQVQCE